jgi:N-acetylglucosamine kinase-like BadF-type ATPase
MDLAIEDPIAAGIVSQAADELARAIEVCGDRLELGDVRRVVAAGGLMRAGSPLLEALAARLADQGRYVVSPLNQEPAAGALALARDGPDHRDQ